MSSMRVLAVVVGFGDPVATPPMLRLGKFWTPKEVAEVVFYGFDSSCEVLDGLLAEGVKVKGGETGEVGCRKLVGGDSEAATR